MRNPADGSPCVSYAVCTYHAIVDSAKLPNNLSTQAADLFATTRAFILGTGKDQFHTAVRGQATLHLKCIAPNPSLVLNFSCLKVA